VWVEARRRERADVLGRALSASHRGDQSIQPADPTSSTAITATIWPFVPIHFNAWAAVKCKGRTRQSAGPPPAIAALRALQVRHEDVAEEAGVQEIGMWTM
jgi:hypothetical protein